MIQISNMNFNRLESTEIKVSHLLFFMNHDDKLKKLHIKFSIVYRSAFDLSNALNTSFLRHFEMAEFQNFLHIIRYSLPLKQITHTKLYVFICLVCAS